MICYVINSTTGCFTFPAFITSMIIARYQVRYTVLVGGVVVSMGYAASAFISNIYGFLVMYGIVAGLLYLYHLVIHRCHTFFSIEINV